MEKSWKFVGKNVYEPCVIHPTNSLNMKLGIMHAVISAAVSIA